MVDAEIKQCGGSQNKTILFSVARSVVEAEIKQSYFW